MNLNKFLKKIKLTIFLPSLLLVNFCAIGQVRQKIGTNSTNIATTAVLELENTTGGFLPPRMTNFQRFNIVSPVAGLIVWCTNCSSNGELQVYNGTNWTNMIGGPTNFSVPEPPIGSIPTITGFQQASIAFTAPAFDGGSPITGYTVTSNPGGFTATGTTSPIIVTGLTIGTSYTFTVVATNAIGNSRPSIVSNVITPFPAPSAPTSIVAQANYKQASITFTAPSGPVTSYTVTSSPGGFTATGTTSPIIVTGLNNETSYTFTVVASNLVGNSPASVSNAVTPTCGAFISTTEYKVFACYNLGATDTTLDPNVPVQAIHGNYYQWGRINHVATASSSSGAIAGWNTTGTNNYDWSDFSKTSNDPCPTGFRIPQSSIFSKITVNNFNYSIGSWTSSDTNFGSALQFGTTTDKSLTLPSSGMRISTNGSLLYRGNRAVYWTSTSINDIFAKAFFFDGTNQQVGNTSLYAGYSIRCMKE